ncbi:MAG TPA: 50S ribosomal protein L17 [Candidatus Eisenbacteria bacterium]|nr:50S ribosomal protein L17 [Candidatus Eisenbacteria bacterium]
MRHRVAGKKLNRSPAHRRALFRNLVAALLAHEAVRTTDAKAKELKRWGDRMITLGKQGTLHARRRAAALVGSRTLVKKLFDELAPRYQERNGGYTRVVKLGVRLGDAAPVSLVELVDRAGSEPETGKKKPQRRRTPAKSEGAAPKKRAAAPKKRAAAG